MDFWLYLDLWDSLQKSLISSSFKMNMSLPFYFSNSAFTFPQKVWTLKWRQKNSIPDTLFYKLKSEVTYVKKTKWYSILHLPLSFLTSPVFCCDYLSDILKSNKLLHLVGAVIYNIKAIKWPQLRTTWIAHTLTWAANFTRILWHGLNRICSSRNLRNFLKPGWAPPIFKSLS